ncbi:MAG: RloB family protein [Negativicutes bacterium]|jgi:hypothetical protein
MTKLVFGRKKNTRDVRKRLLIVCEGEKTEPNYFKAFVVPPELVVVVDGAGCETIRVVERAVELREEAIRKEKPFDEIWCVFDRDNFPAQNFNEAIAKAERLEIKVAYSIEAFEIWYLLHFHYYNTGISRDDYKIKLTALLGRVYRKNDKAMYELLQDKIDIAIKNAQNLRVKQETSEEILYNRNPVTTVDLLVVALRSYRKP